MNDEMIYKSQRAEFLESLIDAIPIPVFYKDASGAYRDCNKAFASMIVGLPRRAIIGKTLFDFFGQIPHERALIATLTNHATNQQIKQPIQVITRVE